MRALRIAAALLAAGTLGAVPAMAEAQPATWNFSQAAVPGAQALGNYGQGVLVAVVDTWVDFHDSEFENRVADDADCIGSNGAASSCKDNTYAPDACTHGTHVAGTIASAEYGVAPEAKILAVQVLSYDASSGQCQGSAQDVAAGIDFAVSKGARVVNLSLGDLVPLIFQSSQITAAIDSAAAAGVVVVVAAGNSSLPFSDNYGNNAVMVAATGPDGQLASYSDSFDLPQGAIGLAAPGGDTGANPTCGQQDCVLSTLPGNKLGLMEGTSMAAPHVSGTVALLISQNPRRTRANILETLASTARPLSGAGDGLLNAAAALKSDAGHASSQAPVAPTSTRQPASTTPPITAAQSSPTVIGNGSIPEVASPPPTGAVQEPATSTSTSPQAGGPVALSRPPGSPARAAPSWENRHRALLAAATALLAIVMVFSARLLVVRARGG